MASHHLQSPVRSEPCLLLPSHGVPLSPFSTQHPGLLSESIIHQALSSLGPLLVPEMPFLQNFPWPSLLLFSSNATLLERLPASLYTVVVFSRSVMSHSLRPHGLQHTSLPCPSPSPEFAQTHVHGVGHVIQPSHPLLPPSPPSLNLSQHQGLFQ